MNEQNVRVISHLPPCLLEMKKRGMWYVFLSHPSVEKFSWICGEAGIGPTDFFVLLANLVEQLKRCRR